MCIVAKVRIYFELRFRPGVQVSAIEGKDGHACMFKWKRAFLILSSKRHTSMRVCVQGSRRTWISSQVIFRFDTHAEFVI